MGPSPTREKNRKDVAFWLNVFVAIALVLMFLQIQDVQQAQDAGRERTYKSQALSCSIKIAIGGDVSQDAACQTPEVLALYDENAEPVLEGLPTEPR